MPYIGFFHTGGKAHVQDNAWGQVGKIEGRQRHEAQARAKSGKGQGCNHSASDKGEQSKARGGPALDKGQLVGADHMDDHGLAPHGFHKPAGLEQRRIAYLHLGQLGAGEVGCQVIVQDAAGYEHGTEHKVHDGIGGPVEDGACGAEPEHKAAHR